MLANIIVFLVIISLLAGASAKIIKDRKRGVKCTGCPYSSTNSNGCSCSK